MDGSILLEIVEQEQQVLLVLPALFLRQQVVDVLHLRNCNFTSRRSYFVQVDADQLSFRQGMRLLWLVGQCGWLRPGLCH